MTDSLQILPDEQSLNALGDPASSIILCCERAKEWLAQALAGDDIEQIVEMKSQAEAMRVYAMQKQLGKDAELSACEIVRRAERCIGIAIRRGQAAGTIRKTGQKENVGDANISSVGDVSGMKRDALSEGPYRLADCVSDEAFDVALDEARAERNLSLANVKRKLRGGQSTDRWARLAELAAAGHTSAQIAQELGAHRSTVVEKARALGIDIPADRVTANTRKLNHDRMLTQFAGALEALVPSCEMIDARQISTDVLAECLSVMDEALREINRLRKRLRKGE